MKKEIIIESMTIQELVSWIHCKQQVITYLILRFEHDFKGNLIEKRYLNVVFFIIFIGKRKKSDEKYKKRRNEKRKFIIEPTLSFSDVNENVRFVMYQ